MSDSPATPRQPVYGWQDDDVERLERYSPGGYHPVKIGDEFCESRYHVVHKLGNGSYSTVWLARDRHTSRYVALKIIVARTSTSDDESCILHLLERHRSSKPDILGHDYAIKLFDEFMIDGPNGQHRCLVCEPAGCSIGLSREASTVWLFQLKIARAMAAKLIMGVHFLHSHGVVHGDLHPNNILLKLPNIDDLSTDEIYNKYSPPVREAVKRLDGAELDANVPPYTVWPLRTVVACEEVADPNIVIADFGEAYIATNQTRLHLNTPVLFSPPEKLIGYGTTGMPADIWILACTLAEILGGRSLFEDLPDPDLALGEIVCTLGKPPQPIWESWENRHIFFREDGSRARRSMRGHSAGSRPLVKRIAETRKDGEDFEEAEKNALVKMMRGMLAWEPHGRSRIEDVVCSEWMEQYGKPAIAIMERKKVESTCSENGEASATA